MVRELLCWLDAIPAVREQLQVQVSTTFYKSRRQK
jgi:hypothetical protein